MRKILKKTIFIALIFQFSYWIPAFTQNVGISDAGASFTPDASSVLELKSTLRGLLIPRMTTAQRVTLGVVPAVAGLLVYDTDLTTFYYWDATATAQWRPLLASSRASSVAGASAGWTTLGNAGTSGATNFIGTTDANDLVFKTNGTEYMRMLSTGNIGIRVATPQQSLSIVGGLNIDQGSSGTTTFTAGTANPALSFGFNSGEGITSKRSGGAPAVNGLEFVTNSINRMSIANNGKIGIGTITPAAVGAALLELNGTASSVAAGPHIQVVTSTDTYPVLQNLNYGHDNISFNFDSYFDGAWRSGYASSSFQIYKIGNALKFNYGVAAAGAALTWNEALRINSTGSITISNVYSLPTAAGTSGQALVSGGATSSWGTLGVAGGGTGATSFTTGSVIFQGATVLSQDNATFFWDNTSKRLGIGTAAPDELLHVSTALAGEGVHIGSVYLGNQAGGATSAIFTHNTVKATAASYALKQTSGGTTSLNAATTKSISFNIADVTAMTVASDKQVGIGTIAPQSPLHIYETTGTTPAAAAGALILDHGNSGGVSSLTFKSRVNVGSDYAYISYTDNNSAALGAYPAATENSLLTIAVGNDPAGGATTDNIALMPSGYVGINCTYPQYMLHVVGDIAASGVLRAAAATVTAGVTACSDIRYKKDIKPLENALEKVLKLNGVTYLWKTSEFPAKNFTKDLQIGVIAQELEKVYPQLVVTDTDGYKSVDYSKLTPILLEAIKEQQVMIHAQKELLEKQQKALNKLQNETKTINTAMEIRMRQLELKFSAESKR
jgi:hypothetical protein